MHINYYNKEIVNIPAVLNLRGGYKGVDYDPSGNLSLLGSKI